MSRHENSPKNLSRVCESSVACVSLASVKECDIIKPKALQPKVEKTKNEFLSVIVKNNILCCI